MSTAGQRSDVRAACSRTWVARRLRKDRSTKPGEPPACARHPEPGLRSRPRGACTRARRDRERARRARRARRGRFAARASSTSARGFECTRRGVEPAVEWSCVGRGALARRFCTGLAARLRPHVPDGHHGPASRDKDRAIESFRHCLELRPHNPVCAYNIACAYTNAGEIDAGLGWLSQAVELGRGRSPDLTAVIEGDSDIAKLRAQPRGAVLLEKMHADAHVADPAPRTFVPPVTAPEAGFPLVVLLPRVSGGGRELDRMDGTCTIARRCVARGPRRTGSSATARARLACGSRRRSDSPSAVGVRGPIVAALTTVQREDRIDPARDLIVGEGSGRCRGSDLAGRARGLVRVR